MLTALREKLNAARKTANDIKAKYAANPETMTDEDQKAWSDAVDDAERLMEQIQKAQRQEEIEKWAGQVPAPATHPVVEEPEQKADQPKLLKDVKVPAVVRVTKHLNFADGGGMTAEQKAYAFGRWFFAIASRDEKSIRFCREHGIELRAQAETLNTAGGFLVPTELSADIIDLREQFGVFRRNTKVVPMASDTKLIPRRTGGVTAYWVGENDAITESEKAWDQISLTARKLAALIKYSSEISEDAIIDIASDLAAEIAYAYALKEDQAGFNGDGTSAHSGIVGVRTALTSLSGTIANIAGLVVGSGNAYSELVLADFEKVVAKLPQYADTPSARWFCHRSFFYEVMVHAKNLAGGIEGREIIDGQRTPMFLGYPVEFAQVMPKVEANSQVCALLGDLKLASKMGDRRQLTIAVSEHANFAADQLTIRGTERIDIVVHDVGNASATASLREPGPVVGLITAAA